MKIPSYHLKAQSIFGRFEQLDKEALAILELKTQSLYEEVNKKYKDIIKEENADEQAVELANKLIIASHNRSVENQTRDLIETMSKKIKALEKIIHSTNKGAVFTLTSDGDLYREPKEKYCYKMHGEAKRLEILRVLETDFKKTGIIAAEIGIANNEALRKAIGEINRKAKNHLKLDKKLIDSKQPSGYRINPAYNFIKE